MADTTDNTSTSTDNTNTDKKEDTIEYSGKAAAGVGEGSHGQYYEEVKWVNGLFSIATNPNTSNGKAYKMLFIGDSRFKTMYDSLVAAENRTAIEAINLEIGEHKWYSKNGANLDWLKNTAIPDIETKGLIEENTYICINLGLNDVGESKSTGEEAAEKYLEYINSKLTDWKNKGSTVGFVSINPVKKTASGESVSSDLADKLVNNTAINAFNSKMGSTKKDFNYIITDSLVSIYPSDIGNDGISYSYTLSKKIYNWILDTVENKVESKEIITDESHRLPPYTADIAMDKDKNITVTYHGCASPIWYFGYSVGVEVWDDAHANDVIRKVKTQAEGGWRWGAGLGLANPGPDQKFEIDASKLELPIYIRLVCSGCPANGYKGGDNFLGFAYYPYSSPPSRRLGTDGCWSGGGYKIVYGHTHIDAPSPPVIVKTSGSTITVKCNPEDINDKDTTHKGQVNDIATDDWYDGDDEGHTFTGYINGANTPSYKCSTSTKKTFKARRYCDDECTEESKYIESQKTAVGATWGLSGTVKAKTSNSIKIKLDQVYGTGVDTTNIPTIKCRLYETESEMENDDLTATVAPGVKEYLGLGAEITDTKSTVTINFISLDTNKNYWYKAWSDGIVNENNIPDNVASGSCSTGLAYEITDYSIDGVSATTAKISAAWESHTSTGVKCIVSLTPVDELSYSTPSPDPITIKSSNGFAVFIELKPGCEYNVIWKFIDDGNNINIQYGHIYTKSITIHDKKTSTCAISFIFTTVPRGCNVNVTYKDSSETTSYGSLPSDEKIILSDVGFNPTIIAKIEGCHPYLPGSGQQDTSINDSEERFNFITKVLSVNYQMIYTYQHKVSFIPTVNLFNNTFTSGSTDREYLFIDKDPITDTEYRIQSITATPIPTEGYQNNALGTIVDETVIYGEKDKRPYVGYRVSMPLRHYYCKYIVKVTIFDGYNYLKDEFGCTIITEFPYSVLYHDDKWYKAMPFVYHNGEWVLAPIFIRSSNKWLECSMDNDENEEEE